MSSTDARAFLTRLEEDEAFRGEFDSVRTADQFWALVAQYGYEFDREEFVQAEKMLLEADEELIAVPGPPDVSDPDENR
jgi:predicted ribosomally synthesized peptide with nif11-like leader